MDRVFRLVYRMVGDRHRAQDYAQETFIRGFRRLADFRGESALSTWLCAIAMSVTLNGLRVSSGPRARGRTGGGCRRSGPDGRRRTPTSRSGCRGRSTDCRRDTGPVFVMHDVEGYTHEEIATALGVQPGTSKAQLFRARARLRRGAGRFREGLSDGRRRSAGRVARAAAREEYHRPPEPPARGDVARHPAGAAGGARHAAGAAPVDSLGRGRRGAARGGRRHRPDLAERTSSGAPVSQLGSRRPRRRG